MTDLKSATSFVGGQLVGVLLPSTENPILTAAGGAGIKMSTCVLNNQGTDTHVWVSKVKSGQSPGSANRVVTNYPLPAGAVLDLAGPTGFGVLDEGDFVSAKVDASSTVSMTIDGYTYSGASGATLSGIQDDTVGISGATGSNVIGTGANRYLLAALRISANNFADWTTYDSLSMACTSPGSSLPMTRLISANYNPSSGATGSVHLYGLTNPPSATTQTITPTATKAGVTLTPMVESISLVGVGSAGATAVDAPVGSAAVNLAVTSAVGHRAFAALGSYDAPLNLTQRVRGFNGSLSAGVSAPQYLTLLDQVGATSVAFTANAVLHAAVGVEFAPA